MERSTIDVSIILNAHREGRLVHRTVRSAQRAIEHARQLGQTVQLIAVLDRPDELTLRYFQENASWFDEVLTVSLGDLGQARNRGVEAASGRYVCFLDADDLFGVNWVAAAVAFANSLDPATPHVLHSELNLCFGRELFIQPHIDCFDRQFNPLNLVEFNSWSALSFVDREFFLDGNQFESTNLPAGYGFEDWQWHCKTMSRGARHRVVPETVHFIRLKDNSSLCVQSQAAGAVIRPSDYLNEETLVALQRGNQTPPDRDIIPHPTTSDSTNGGSAVWQLAYRCYRSLKRLESMVISNSHSRIASYLREWLELTKRQFALTRRLPEWLRQELDAAARIEPSLEMLSPRKLPVRYRTQSQTAHEFIELMQRFDRRTEDVILLPGISDAPMTRSSLSGMVNQAICMQSPQNLLAIVCTGSGAEWQKHLPRTTRVIALDDALRSATCDERLHHMMRALLQRSPRSIHSFANPMGTELFHRFGKQLGATSRLVQSITASELQKGSSERQQLLSQLPRYFDHVATICTETPELADELQQLFWLDDSRFRSFAHPVSRSWFEQPSRNAG